MNLANTITELEQQAGNRQEGGPRVSAQTTKSGFIKASDGIRIHYIEAGAGGAIVFIPGYCDRIPRALGSRRVRCLKREEDPFARGGHSALLLRFRGLHSRAGRAATS
jgi:hypothetical protein